VKVEVAVEVHAQHLVEMIGVSLLFHDHEDHDLVREATQEVYRDHLLDDVETDLPRTQGAHRLVASTEQEVDLEAVQEATLRLLSRSPEQPLLSDVEGDLEALLEAIHLLVRKSNVRLAQPDRFRPQAGAHHPERVKGTNR